MKKEKPWFEKIGESSEGGTVNLTKEDKKQILESYYEEEKSLKQKIRESEFFIYGVLFAILGSYLATWLYEFVNGVYPWNIVNFLVLIIFLVCLSVFFVRLTEEKSNIILSRDQLKMWEKADYIKYGKSFRGLDKKEFKSMVKDMKLSKNEEERKEIYDRYFYGPDNFRNP
jgi:hypothetical protein